MKRIVQWGTGLVGAAAARKIIEHPQLELVGCYAHGANKIGHDVGTILGLAPIGVIATDDIEALIALRPDCVLYMPLVWQVEHMVRILEAGINMVSTANFITGRSYGLDEQKRLDDAAKRGGVTLHGTGINPGQANVLGLVAAAGCGQIERIVVREAVDATKYATPDSWKSLGFGGSPDVPGLSEQVRLRALVFIDTVEMMADALKAPLDDIVHEVEFATATEDLDLDWMDIRKGTVCGLKMTYAGIVAGRKAIELQLMWRLGYAMTPDWRPEGYVVEIEGQPNVRLTFETKGDPSDGGLTTAMNAVNAILPVCAARAGMVTAAELPPVTAAYMVVGTA